MQSLFDSDEIVETQKSDMTREQLYNRLLFVFLLVPLVLVLIYLLLN